MMRGCENNTATDKHPANESKHVINSTKSRSLTWLAFKAEKKKTSSRRCTCLVVFFFFFAPLHPCQVAAITHSSPEQAKASLHSINTPPECVCILDVCECSRQTRGQPWRPPAERCIDLLLVNKQLDATGGSMRLGCL